ncbi:Adenylate cyclase [Diplonema papillatum]|nr:Adenylate cyclase [Diplonema papillatum]
MADVDAEDSYIRATAVAIRDFGGYLSVSTQSEPVLLNVIVQNVTIQAFVNVMRLQIAGGLDWWLTVGLPSDEVLESVRTQALLERDKILLRRADSEEEEAKIRRNSMLVTAGLTVLMSVVALVASALIMAPLRGIQEQMESYGVKMVDCVEPVASSLYEVRCIQHYFTRMVSKLAEYKAYVPTAILADEDEAAEAPSGDVTILFTDIKGSTRLWEKSPTDMNVAMDLHNEAIRAVSEKYDGYEVKTIGMPELGPMRAPTSSDLRKIPPHPTAQPPLFN